MMNEKALRLFGLYEDSGRTSPLKRLAAVCVPPAHITREDVTAAWSHAVMYSAKGLTLPDYEAAVKLLQKRHPSWQIIDYEFVPIGLDLSKADNDVAEGT